MNRDFLALIHSERVSEPTRQVMHDRLKSYALPDLTARASDAAYRTLVTVAERMIPQSAADPVDSASALLKAKRNGQGNGWRYAGMPKDDVSLNLGLTLLEDYSLSHFGTYFGAAGAEQQIAMLTAAQAGQLQWETFDSSLWFEELLTDLVESYVSHPSAMAAMGFDGFAFLPRWEHITLNTSESWEPLPE